MKSIPVFYQRRLIGTYEGPIEGTDSVILVGRSLIAQTIPANQYIIATVLYDDQERKAGLELFWCEGIDYVKGFTPDASLAPTPRIEPDRLPRRPRLKNKPLALHKDQEDNKNT